MQWLLIEECIPSSHPVELSSPRSQSTYMLMAAHPTIISGSCMSCIFDWVGNWERRTFVCFRLPLTCVERTHVRRDVQRYGTSVYPHILYRPLTVYRIQFEPSHLTPAPLPLCLHHRNDSSTLSSLISWKGWMWEHSLKRKCVHFSILRCWELLSFTRI